MTLPITLGLPPLAPGEAPPARCPHCGAELADWVTEYECGANYFVDAKPCPTPRASAVLASLADRMGFTDADNCGVNDAASGVREMERERGILPSEDE